jgi:hypothetical protein
MQHPRRQPSSYSPPWVPKILRIRNQFNIFHITIVVRPFVILVCILYLFLKVSLRIFYVCWVNRWRAFSWALTSINYRRVSPNTKFSIMSWSCQMLFSSNVSPTIGEWLLCFSRFCMFFVVSTDLFPVLAVIFILLVALRLCYCKVGSWQFTPENWRSEIVILFRIFYLPVSYLKM